MKRYTIKYMAAALAMTMATGATAQSMRSAYFLESATYRHQLNPAFSPEKSYFSIPILGNMNIGMQGNVGLSDFVYKYDDPTGKYNLTTFMNPKVSADEFLGNIDSKNRINADIDITIFSVGFKAFHGFNTIDVAMHSQTSINLPYELFNFMKRGMDKSAGSHYEIKDLGFRSTNYLEFALGHSHTINERLSVGGKVKFLVGLARVDASIDRMNIDLEQDAWRISMDGQVDAAVKGGYFKTAAEKFADDRPTGRQKVSGYDVDGGGLNGFGMAFDLGAVYKFDYGLTASAALRDLGYISWTESVSAVNKGKDPFTFDGFTNIGVDNDSPNKSIEDQFDDVQNDLERLVNFYPDGEKTSTSTSLAATMDLGVEYELPVYKPLSFGFLWTSCFNDAYGWNEARFSANIEPVKWFGASTSCAFSTFGTTYGMMLNFHPGGFNFFVGTDAMLGTTSKNGYIPLNSLNVNVNFGFNVLL